MIRPYIKTCTNGISLCYTFHSFKIFKSCSQYTKAVFLKWPLLKDFSLVCSLPWTISLGNKQNQKHECHCNIRLLKKFLNTHKFCASMSKLERGAPPCMHLLLQWNWGHNMIVLNAKSKVWGLTSSYSCWPSCMSWLILGHQPWQEAEGVNCRDKLVIRTTSHKNN